MVLYTPVRIGCLYDKATTSSIYSYLSAVTFTQFLTNLDLYTYFGHLPTTDVSNQARMTQIFGLSSLQTTLFSKLTASLLNYNQATSDNLSGAAFSAIFTGSLALSGQSENMPSTFTVISCIGDLRCYKYN
jgi:hypothetical protein